MDLKHKIEGCMWPSDILFKDAGGLKTRLYMCVYVDRYVCMYVYMYHSMYACMYACM